MSTSTNPPSHRFSSLALNPTSSTTQSNILQSRITSKRAELENLRQLRDLSASLATQMTQLEEKLSTLRDGTESVAVILQNWEGVLRAIGLAALKVPRPKDEEGEEGEKQQLPVTLVRIPIERNGETGG